MRPAAEVEKLAGLINRNLFIGLGELLDEVALHEVAFTLEALQAFIARQKFARIRQVLLHQFLHFLFDFLQVLGRERGRTVKVVKESALGRRPVAELGLRKQLEHRRRQQMRRRMPVNSQRLRILFRKDAQAGVLFQRPGEVDQILRSSIAFTGCPGSRRFCQTCALFRPVAG